jgi:hypothetical protein
MYVVPENVKSDLRESFYKWAEVHTEWLANEDYIAVLDWLKWCIQNGENLANIGDITPTQFVNIIWG